MDPAPNNAASVNDIWVDLSPGVKRAICNRLAEYSGPDVNVQFLKLCGWAARRDITTKVKAQMVATGKRKRDDGDVTELPRAPEKKAKVSEATTPLQSAGVDLVSPKIPFAWPGFRHLPILFGRPTISSIAGKSLTATPPSIATTSAAAPNIPKTLPPILPESKRVPVAQFATSLPRKPVQQEPECDEQFTFADRRPSHPQPTAGPGAPHQHRPTAQDASANQPPPVSSPKPSPGTHGRQPVSTIYKPPFTGVDMSSLKIPANSNVSVTMNFFQAPSVLHQNMDSSAPRKLKCIQCKEPYMEAQNTAMECRRHTGTCADFEHLSSLRGMTDPRD